MTSGSGLGRQPGLSPFEPFRDSFGFKLPSPALERLCDLAAVPAHYRPTFANAMNGIFAKSQRWHRMASRAIEMDGVGKELAQVAKDARKLKESLDKLSPQARMALGLYGQRLDQFPETEPHEAVRNQIEDLVNVGAAAQAGAKVAQLSWAAGRIEAAANTETWAKPKNGALASWKSSGGGRFAPRAETFELFVTEVGRAAHACNSPLQFDPANITGDLIAFLEAAQPHLPAGFIPDEVFNPEPAAAKPAPSSGLKKLAFWSKPQ
jgi:hypothetical protein